MSLEGERREEEGEGRKQREIGRRKGGTEGIGSKDRRKRWNMVTLEDE